MSLATLKMVSRYSILIHSLNILYVNILKNNQQNACIITVMHWQFKYTYKKWHIRIELQHFSSTLHACDF